MVDTIKEAKQLLIYSKKELSGYDFMRELQIGKRQSIRLMNYLEDDDEVTVFRKLMTGRGKHTFYRRFAKAKDVTL